MSGTASLKDFTQAYLIFFMIVRLSGNGTRDRCTRLGICPLKFRKLFGTVFFLQRFNHQRGNFGTLMKSDSTGVFRAILQE